MGQRFFLSRRIIYMQIRLFCIERPSIGTLIFGQSSRGGFPDPGNLSKTR